MAKHKRKPQRTCIACRAVKNKRDLIRVVRTPEGRVIIDPTGKTDGRGAYLCRQTSCYERGLNKQRLAQVLKVSLSADELAALRATLQTELSKV